jgi:hypothetical protein
VRCQTGAEDREANHRQSGSRAGERERSKQQIELFFDGKTPQMAQPRLPAIHPDVDIRQIEPVGQLARSTADFQQTPQARDRHDGEERIVDRENPRGSPDVEPGEAETKIASSCVDFAARLGQYPRDQETAEHEEDPDAGRAISIADRRGGLVTDEDEQERQSPEAIETANASACDRVQNDTSQKWKLSAVGKSNGGTGVTGDCQVASSKLCLIPQMGIGQAKLLLQLLDDTAECLFDDPPVGLSELHTANAPVRVSGLFRLPVMNDHSDKAAAFRRGFSDRLGNCVFKFRGSNRRSLIPAPPGLF